MSCDGCDHDYYKQEHDKAVEAMGFGSDDARWRPGESAIDALIRERNHFATLARILAIGQTNEP